MRSDQELWEDAEQLCRLSERVQAQHAELVCRVAERDVVRQELEWRREHRRAQKLVPPDQTYYG